MELKDRVVQYPGRVRMREVGSSVQKEYDLEPSEGIVTQEGTPLNAATLNSWADNVKVEALENSLTALEVAHNAETAVQVAKQEVEAAVSEIQATKRTNMKRRDSKLNYKCKQCDKN